MPNPYLLLTFGLALAAVGFMGHRHGVQTTTDHYNAVMAEAALESERITRQAIASAAERERIERDRLKAAADEATAKARAEADIARKRASDLSRRIQELSDADPSVDAWRVTPLPDPVRGLLSEGDNPNGTR